MTPSFLTLFKRGRYFRLSVFSESEEAEEYRVRIEAERFAAAAVGFCMTHNSEFRRKFTRHACGDQIQGSITPDVEPEHWADLFLHIGRSRVCVIEFKIGAHLQPKQDPSKEAFWEEPNGYGFKFGQAYPTVHKHYIVLGRSYPFFGCEKRDGWSFNQMSWGDLADVITQCRKNRLLADLWKCLAGFGIWDFSAALSRKVFMMRNNALGASAAWQVLWDAYRYPGLKLSTGPTAFRCDSHWAGREDWFFGIEVKATANDRLTRLIRPSSGGAIAWFGYEPHGEAMKLSFWFYCESLSIAKWVRKLLRHRLSEEPLLENPEEPTHIGFSINPGYDRPELDCFIAMIGIAADLAEQWHWQYIHNSNED